MDKSLDIVLPINSKDKGNNYLMENYKDKYINELQVNLNNQILYLIKNYTLLNLNFLIMRLERN